MAEVKTRKCKKCGAVKELSKCFYRTRAGYHDTVCTTCRNVRTTKCRKAKCHDSAIPAWAGGYLRAIKRTKRARKYGIDTLINERCVTRVWITQSGRCAVTGVQLTPPPPEFATHPEKWVAKLTPSKRVTAAVLIHAYEHGKVLAGSIMFVSAAIADMYYAESNIDAIRGVLKALSDAMNSPAPPIPGRAATLSAAALPVSLTHPTNIT